MNPLRLHLIISDDRFEHPQFVARVLEGVAARGLPVTCVAASVTLDDERFGLRRKASSYLYLLRALGIVNCLKAAWRSYRTPAGMTLEAVLAQHGIPTRRIVFVNAAAHLAWMRERAPDVVLHTGGQYFRQELLSLPAIGCINRHSSLLPKYGGVWPVVWALYRGEREVGASIHWMMPKIDAGAVIEQRPVAVREDDTLASLYSRCFKASAEAAVDALAAIASGEVTPAWATSPVEYLKAPSPSVWAAVLRRTKLF